MPIPAIAAHAIMQTSTSATETQASAVLGLLVLQILILLACIVWYVVTCIRDHHKAKSKKTK